MTLLPATSLAVRRLAFASLVANIGIVLTGGAVRLTGSGLGCPTWPRCTGESWTATAEMGLHGTVEFGNRTLTFVLGLIALAGLIAALQRPRRRSLVWLAAAVLAGIAAQGLIGGIVVWTDLDPGTVGGHFLVSMGLIAVAYTFWRRVDEPDGPARASVPGPLRTLAWLVAGTAAALLVVGTLVTGSGPHAGDPEVARNGLDPEVISQVHADLAFLLLGLAVAAWFGFRASAPSVATSSGGPAAGAPATGGQTAGGPAAGPARGGRSPARAAGLLVLVLLAQGAVGLVQHFAGLPELLVWLHLLGSCLVWVAALNLLHATRVRLAPAVPAPAASVAAHPTPVG